MGTPVPRRAGAFTLIEILVVIAIIGVLAGLLLAAVIAAMGRGKKAVAIRDIEAIETGFQTYFERNHTLPEDPWVNYAAAHASEPADVTVPPAGPTFLYRLLGSGNLSLSVMEFKEARLRSTLDPDYPMLKADVVLLDPWARTSYLYVRGIPPGRISHPWRMQWPGSRERGYNLWSVGPDRLCDSCHEVVVNFPRQHDDGLPPAGNTHRGGDRNVGNDVNNWGLR